MPPLFSETATEYADAVGRDYAQRTNADHKKRHGQFLTPVAIAEFMASLATPTRGVVRILDPGAGSGVLACAAAEFLSRFENPPDKVRLDAFEIDPKLADVLRTSLTRLRSNLRSRGVSLEFQVREEDFVLRNAGRLDPAYGLFRSDEPEEEYDLVITNPPYFKLPKSDPRAQAAARIVDGQPNIYAVFLAIGAGMLAPGGQLVGITPRSFASGRYFQRFREEFFRRMRPERIHIFDSRREAFERDGVLQENVILAARRHDGWARTDADAPVIVSVSRDARDLAASECRSVPLCELLDMTTRDRMLRIPATVSDADSARRVDEWTGTLRSYGLEVSTGPVVAFRAEELLCADGDVPRTHAPLMWLQHVRAMKVEWPLAGCRKPQYLQTSDRARTLLVRNRNYVLLRRFSAKEERRRLTAAPWFADGVAGESLGLENHLNYVHRPGGELSPDEAAGLAALYNSELMDRYYRTLNGSTQVGATELRRMPLPPLETIVAIGRRWRERDALETDVEEIVRAELGDAIHVSAGVDVA